MTIPTTWDYEDLRKSTGKSFLLQFLPYVDGREALGYEPRYQTGSLEEFFTTMEAAQNRAQYLVSSRAIERYEIFRLNPKMLFTGPPLAEWHDETNSDGEKEEQM